ncbi:MAG: hypothetical protein JW915_03075 [Chitinispirillaceae bacterium]|nr:hypothetical protein [Chitinispirillaceae bacterium]
MELQELYFGSDLKPADVMTFECGPVSFLYQNGMIRSVMYGKTELIRRIYMALRDSVWNTIPYTVSKPEIRQNENTFSLSFNANHVHDSIKFQWKGLIECSNDGIVRFQMRGKSLSTFYRNRIGLCVLLPLSFSGKDVLIIDAKNTATNGVFPVQIAPHQPFTSISKVKGSAPHGTSYELSFDGDIFEMEDQRNWTDASYKIYSTPLSQPIPVIVNENDEISQSVTLLIKSGNQITCEKEKKERLSVPQDRTRFFRIPQLGLHDSTTDPVSPPAINYLNGLKINHCRYDLIINEATLISDLQNIAQRCGMYKVPIELALYCKSLSLQIVDQLIDALIIAGIRICRFCIYDDNKVTSQETLEVIAPPLKLHFPDSLIASGTDFYFVEINRKHPPLTMVEQICYSANPQVHTFDTISVMENLEGIEETLKHVKTFAGEIPAIISPLTLRPRKNPGNPRKDGGVDVRQQGLFCSSWTAGVIQRAASGGASSITLYDIFGDGGVIRMDGSAVFPAYIVLLWLSELSGQPGILCQSTSTIIQGMIIHSPDGDKMLIANHSEQSHTVIIEGLPDEFSSKVLDQNSFAAAVSNPIAWNSMRGKYHLCEEHRWETQLLPYAVALLSLS